MAQEVRTWTVQVVRPCYLMRKLHAEIGEQVALPFEHAQDAISSGRCIEVDKLPRAAAPR